MNQTECILIGETLGSQADQVTCTVLSSQCSAPQWGEDTAKSAPSHKEEIVPEVLKDIPQRAEESKLKKPEKTYCNWESEAQTY